MFSWGVHWTYGVMLRVSFRSFNCSHWETTKKQTEEKVWGTERSLQAVSWLWTSEIFQLICSACYITHSSLSHVILSSQGWTMSSESYYQANMNHNLWYHWSHDQWCWHEEAFWKKIGMFGACCYWLVHFILSSPLSLASCLIFLHAAAIITFFRTSYFKLYPLSSPLLSLSLLTSHLFFSRFLRCSWRSSARLWFEDYAR